MTHRIARVALPLLICATLLCHSAMAHKGGIIVQQIDGRLVTGYDDETSGLQTIGDRAFALLFPSSLANDVPSFLSFAQAPSGSASLPVGSNLYWDFLPMHFDGVTSNLMFWDASGGQPEDVHFSPAPQTDTTLTLYTQGFTDNASVDGAAAMVRGKRLGVTTADNLALHAHRWFFMDSQTSTPEGIYLIAMQVRADGFASSEPFFVAAATSSIPASVLDDVALPWVAEHVDDLLLEGDFNFDGEVDSWDYMLWRQQFGSSGDFAIGNGSANGNYDGVVDAADYTVWRDQMANVALLVSYSTPEPTGVALLVLAAFVCTAPARRLNH
ncbi:hypothetical protein Pla123a_18930 [Posidoniimonas polymericola]|uniref:Dockerin domain-containing protein n=1 Tax=Posidoniimonas polymericola TaxID=2528002 RepID=A0A5C5YQZ9_9BACT|nr:hypothetical protein [Posidoniimonas polymericola]TWT77238.1 hypothetical protein Pla123a_18930 [Posidoniimonas polymericola]